MPDLEAPKKFPPVGRCIYCGTGAALTDEHIIPYGLGGDIVLPDASCKSCARITGAIVERYVLRAMLGTVRAQRNIQTRRPKERPKTFRLTIDSETGKEDRKEDFRFRPRIFSMLMLPYPTILWDLPRDESGMLQGAKMLTIRDRAHDLTPIAARHPGAKRFTVYGEYNPLMFARMLAKMAHAFAVAEYGYGSFPMLLPPLILGTQQGTNFNHLVGGSLETLAKSQNVHELRLERVRTPVTDTEYLVAHIRLFADFGAPLYYVAVGPSAGLGAPIRAQ